MSSNYKSITSIIFLLCTFISSNAQNSKILIEIRLLPQHANSYSTQIKNFSNNVIFDEHLGGNNPNIITKYFTVNVPNSNFPLTIRVDGSWIALGSPLTCSEDYSSNYNISNISSDLTMVMEACTGTTKIYSFKLPQLTNSLGVCENIVINKKKITKYSYSKTNAAGSWIDIPASFKSGDILTVSPSNIPDLANYSGPLYIKGSFVNGAEIFETDILIYDIKNCAPNIINQEITNNNCFNGTSGAASFTFDRDLDADEYFLMNVDNLNNDNDFSYNVGNQGSPANQIPFLPDRKFNLTGLASGQFRLRYQTFRVGSTIGSSVKTADFNITNPVKLEFTIPQPVPIVCKDEATGSITVNATGGTLPYQYSLNNTTWQAGNVFTGLPAGNYTVHVKDNNNCAAPDGPQTVAITEPPTRVTISNPIVADPVLNNQNTGSIAIDVTGGTSPYSYAWIYNNPNGHPNTFIPTNEDITTLYAGTYTVTVTDASGCTTTASYTLTDPPVLVPGITVNQLIACFGTNAGILTANATGGRPGYSYQWFKNASFFSSNQQITNLGPGDYRLVVTDSDGLGGSQEAFYTLSQPASAVNGNANFTNSTCFGANDASITITAFGGTPFATPSPPYTYTWTKEGNPIAGITPFINNLAPGNYSCVITDRNGCTKTINNIILSEPPVLQILSSNVTNLLDASNPTGTISVTATGGSGPLMYLWSNGATTASINGLYAGTYTLTITDSAHTNCTLLSSYTITAPPPFVINIQQNGVINCFGEATARLEVIASGGTTGASPNEYTYLWIGANIPISEPIDNATLLNLPAGTYRVQVRDANNIVRTQNFIVNQPPLLTATYTKTDISCAGVNNGAINLTPTGGTLNYTYEWKNQLNQVIATTEDVSNLAVGVYSCSVTDAKGCTFMVNNISITAPTLLVFDAQNSIPVSTATASDGSINVVITGGSPPYNYAWTTAGGASIGTNNPVLDNLPVGTYNLMVTDANGCTLTNSYLITVMQPLTAIIEGITPINCNGNSTGSIRVNPTGGLPPYTILWSNGATTATISGLRANTYSVTITDSSVVQNTFTATYALPEPSVLSIDTVTATNINCFGSNSGSVDLAVSGGTAPYTFQWRNAASTIISTSEDISNLNVGTYTCTIRDANNCTLTTSPVTILTNPPLTATVSGSTNVLINGQSTGAIDINVTGGFGGYTYTWSNGSTTQDLSNIPAGTYAVVVTDALGCTTALNNIQITQPTPLVVTPNILQVITCFGGTDGRITANVSGGVSPYVYTWTLPNGTFSNQAIVSNSIAGIYNLQVRDVNNATAIITITLAEPDELAGTFTGTPVSCGGNADGTISINPTGGSGVYSYLWANGATTQTITNASVGNYVVLVTDSNGCEKLFTGGEVLAGGGIIIQETIQNVTCAGPDTGSISLMVSGGSNQFSISWDNPALSGFTVTNLTGGTYTGTITDIGNNCIIPFSYSLSQPVNVSFNLPETITLCQGQNTTLNPNVTGNNLTYNWTSDNGFSSAQPGITVASQGTYTLTVTSDNGCSFSDSVFVEVLSESIKSEYLVASQTYKDEEIILINVSDPTNETYEWVFPSEAVIVSQNPQTAIVKFTQVGVYEIGLKATNDSGCVLYDYNQLVVEENPGLPEDKTNTIIIKNFKVYPNPTTDFRFNVEVELLQSLPISISIYQVPSGSLVDLINFPASKNHLKEYNLNVSSGVYYIILRTPGNVQTKKLIIN